MSTQYTQFDSDQLQVAAQAISDALNAAGLAPTPLNIIGMLSLATGVAREMEMPLVMIKEILDRLYGPTSDDVEAQPYLVLEGDDARKAMETPIVMPTSAGKFNVN